MISHDAKAERVAMMILITMVGGGLGTMACGAIYLLLMLSHP